MNALQDALVELIRRTSAEIPDDVHKAILDSLEQEKKGTIAESAMKIIEQNIELAKNKSQPICQDTGSILFYVDCPIGFDQLAFDEAAREAVKLATKKGFLRQNSVDSLTGKNDGTNVGPGSPTIHFHQNSSPQTTVRLVLKGGGCENVGAQYSLPNEKLKANRDLDGCRKVILDAVLQAQGKGCGPGILGVCVGGDRATGYEHSKLQFLRKLDDQNENQELNRLERDLGAYEVEMGAVNRHTVSTHHGASAHAAELVALLRRLAPCPSADGSLAEVERLTRLQWATEARALLLDLENEALRDQLQAERAKLEDEREQIRGHWSGIDSFKRSRRYRLAHLLGKPLDLLRRRAA